MRARIHSLHVKAHKDGERGIPKPSVDDAQVTEAGVEGDYNVYRQAKKAGTKDYAVMLLSIETLHTLASEGWPVAPGDLGENVTLEGFAYDTLAVGDRVALGGDVVVEISEACQPCINLATLPYVGQAKIALFLKTLLGRRGWYARVIVEGRLQKDQDVRRVTRPE